MPVVIDSLKADAKALIADSTLVAIGGGHKVQRAKPLLEQEELDFLHSLKNINDSRVQKLLKKAKEEVILSLIEKLPLKEGDGPDFIEVLAEYHPKLLFSYVLKPSSPSLPRGDRNFVQKASHKEVRSKVSEICGNNQAFAYKLLEFYAKEVSRGKKVTLHPSLVTVAAREEFLSANTRNEKKFLNRVFGGFGRSMVSAIFGQGRVLDALYGKTIPSVAASLPQPDDSRSAVSSRHSSISSRDEDVLGHSYVPDVAITARASAQGRSPHPLTPQAAPGSASQRLSPNVGEGRAVSPAIPPAPPASRTTSESLSPTRALAPRNPSPVPPAQPLEDDLISFDEDVVSAAASPAQAQPVAASPSTASPSATSLHPFGWIFELPGDIASHPASLASVEPAPADPAQQSPASPIVQKMNVVAGPSTPVSKVTPGRPAYTPTAPGSRGSSYANLQHRIGGSPKRSPVNLASRLAAAAASPGSRGAIGKSPAGAGGALVAATDTSSSYSPVRPTKQAAGHQVFEDDYSYSPVQPDKVVSSCDSSLDNGNGDYSPVRPDQRVRNNTTMISFKLDAPSGARPCDSSSALAVSPGSEPQRVTAGP